MPPDPDRMAYWLLKTVNRAVREFGMLTDGDRVAVALSGGKDSLGLLRLLQARRRSAPERYELLALHVLGDGRGPLELPAAPAAWCRAEGVELHAVDFGLGEQESLPLSCERCSRLRRKALFEAARATGCNVVALGHHADDLAQTTLMNLIYHGAAETMAPRRDFFDGALRVIRPLCYVTEGELRRFARACGFPPGPPPCPQAAGSKRHLAAELLAQAVKASPSARTNLIRAGRKEKHK